jgi:hypothetical protein
VSDKISDVISKLETITMREALDKGQITEDEYFIEYGKAQEQIRIIDALMNSDLDSITVHKVRKLIKEEK